MTQNFKKILLLHSSSDLYGSSVIFLSIVDILKKNQYILYVILSTNGPLVKELEKRGVEVVFVNLGVLRKKYLNFSGLVNRLRNILNAKKEILKLAEEKCIDLVYTNTSVVLVGGFIAAKKKLPHIWHLHETPVAPKWYPFLLGRIVNHYSSLVICVSNTVREHWTNWIKKQKICTIYNGIKSNINHEFDSKSIREKFNIDSNDRVVAMIGRIQTLKGQNYFIEIAQNILYKLNNIKFLIVGDAYAGNEVLVHQLKERIEQLNLHDKIILTGFIPDIHNVLKNCSILIHPSVMPDSFPTVLLEAIEVGVPIVATNLGGAKELIEDGKSGFLVPLDDPSKAADIIIGLMNDTDLAQLFINESRKRVQAYFSFEQFQKELSDKVASVIENHLIAS